VSVAANGLFVVNQLTSVTAGSGQTQDYTISGENIGLHFYTAGPVDSLKVRGAVANSINIQGSTGVGTVQLTNSSFNAIASLELSKVYSNGNSYIDGCTFFGALNVYANTTIPNAGSIIAKITDCVFKSSLTAVGSYMLDMRNLITTGNRGAFVLDQCTFINTGSNGSTSAAITAPYNEAMYTAAKTNNFFDTTITTIYTRNWGLGSRIDVTDPTTNSYGVRVTYTL
jgi:hypothetical protein